MLTNSLKLQLKNLLNMFQIIKIPLPVIFKFVFSALAISFVKPISFIPIYLLGKSLFAAITILPAFPTGFTVKDPVIFKAA